MKYLLSNANLFINQQFHKTDLLIENGLVCDLSASPNPSPDTVVFNLNNKFIFPGFVDVHVHLREPGFFYKESILSGTSAAARGGFTAVMSMPNLNPVPDCVENLSVQLDLIKRNAVTRVFPYGAISKRQQGLALSDMEEMSEFVAAFSDDGHGVQSAELMLQAMQKAKRLNKIICAHCEDNSLLNDGYIHDGRYARLNQHKGICSESEWGQLKRDLTLAKKTGCAYHACHISTKESVELIRQAKADGVDVSCETAPHYLAFNDMELKDDGCFKMNPPIRSEEDRLALIEGLKDGTVDMIATDHAPHSAEEKSKGLRESLMGIVGLETAFAVTYTRLVKSGILSLPHLINLFSTNPANRFNINQSIEIGKPANLTVFELDTPYVINPDEFLSKGKSTPFTSHRVYGRCLLTMVEGKIAWQDESASELISPPQK